MKLSSGAWCVAAAVLVFGPVGWRVLSWQRPEPQAVDADLSRAGEALFKHDWQPKDRLSPNGDGLGPVFNARSCVACHHQNGPGGGGGLDHNVTTYAVLPADGPGQAREGVIHTYATAEKYRETLALLDPTLPPVSQVALGQLVVLPGKGSPNGLLSLPAHVQLSQRNTPALFGSKLIDEIPDRVLIAHERAQRLKHGMAPGNTETLPVGRLNRLADGRIGRFGWKAQTAHLADFVQAACANELGLGNPNQAQPQSLAAPSYRPAGLDLTQAQCDQLTAFVAALDRPVERLPAESGPRSDARAGSQLFGKVGCADCHTPNLGSVEGLYSDLMLHRMGETLEGGGTGYEGETPSPRRKLRLSSEASGPSSDEWRTPPLWGVADSAPYLHDGRASTLKEAIELHAGQAAASAQRFANLRPEQQAQLLAFLRTLRAP